MSPQTARQTKQRNQRNRNEHTMPTCHLAIRPMSIRNYIVPLDRILPTTGEKVLSRQGMQAVDKANQEYQHFPVQTPSSLDEAYPAANRKPGKAARKRAMES